MTMTATQSVCLKKHSMFVLTSSIDEISLSFFSANICIKFEGTETPGNHLLYIPWHFLLKKIGCTGFDNKHLLRYSARYIYDKKNSFFGQLMKFDCSVFITDKLDGDFERTRGDQVTRK